MQKTVNQLWKWIPIVLFAVFGVLYGISVIFHFSRSAWIKTPEYAWIGLASIITGVFVLILCAIALQKGKPLCTVYLMLAIPLGILYLFLIPPMSAPDERSHFNTAYVLASEWHGVKEPDDPFNRILRKADTDPWLLKKYVKTSSDYSRIFDDLRDSPRPEDTEFTEKKLVLLNPFSIAYLLPAVVIYFGILLQWSFTRIALAATIPNLVIFIFGTYYGIRKIPFGKAAMLTLAILPITLQQGSSLSYDALLFGSSFAVTGIGLKWAVEKASLRDFTCILPSALRKKTGLASDASNRFLRITPAEVFVFLLCAVNLLFLKKGIYAFLLLIYPLLSLRRDHLKRLTATKRRKWLLVLLFAAFILWFVLSGKPAMIAGMLTQKPYLMHVFKSGRAPIFYLQHPDILIQMLIATVKKEGRDIIYQAFGGRLGWLNLYANHYISYLLALVFFLLLFRSKNDAAEYPLRWHVILFFIGFLPCILCVAAMLIYHTTPDSKTITGIQGRYFLPVLLTMLLGLFRWKKPVRNILSDRMLILTTVFLIWLSTMSSYGFLSN